VALRHSGAFDWHGWSKKTVWFWRECKMQIYVLTLRHDSSFPRCLPCSSMAPTVLCPYVSLSVVPQGHSGAFDCDGLRKT